MNDKLCSSTSTAKPCGASSADKASWSCHANGSGGGGAPSASLTASPAAEVNSNIVPCGIQALKMMRPSAVTTRDISAAAAAGSEAKITAKTDTMTSAPASSTGTADASPGTNVIVAPSLAARSRATSSSRAAGSTPVTWAPHAAASSAAFPVPQTRSTTRSPGRSDARSITTLAAGNSCSAVLSYRPSPQSKPGGAVRSSPTWQRYQRTKHTESAF